MFFYFLTLNIYFRCFIFLLNPNNIWHWRVPIQGLLNDFIAASLFYLFFQVLFFIVRPTRLRQGFFLLFAIGWTTLNFINYEYASSFNVLLPLSWFKEVQNVGAMGSVSTLLEDLLNMSVFLQVVVPVSISVLLAFKFSKQVLKTNKFRYLIAIFLLGVLAQSTTLYPDLQPKINSVVQSHLFKYWYYAKEIKAFPKKRTAPLPQFSENFKKIVLEEADSKALLLPTVKAEKPNIVVIILESYRFFEVGAYGNDLGVTPNFDRYAKNGILFRDVYSMGHLTRTGQWAILCGAYRHKGGSVFTEYPNHGVECLSDILARRGYDNWWFHGQSAAYDSQGYFMKRHKVQHIQDRLTFPKEAEVLGWGLADLDLMKLALSKQKEAKDPFFWIIQSQSNHHPFETPPEFKKEWGFSTKVNNYLNTFYYTDYTLGYFLDNFRKTPAGKNSVVVVVGDHGTGIPLPSKEKITGEQDLLKYKVPLMVLYPEHELITAKTIETVASQADILPTLLDLLKIEKEFPIMGRSLARNYSNRFSKGFNNGDWLLHDGKMYFTSPKRKIISADTGEEIPATEADKLWFDLNDEIDDVQDWMIQQTDPQKVYKKLREHGWNRY